MGCSNFCSQELLRVDFVGIEGIHDVCMDDKEIRDDGAIKKFKSCAQVPATHQTLLKTKAEASLQGSLSFKTKSKRSCRRKGRNTNSSTCKNEHPKDSIDKAETETEIEKSARVNEDKGAKPNNPPPDIGFESKQDTAATANTIENVESTGVSITNFKFSVVSSDPSIETSCPPFNFNAMSAKSAVMGTCARRSPLVMSSSRQELSVSVPKTVRTTTATVLKPTEIPQAKRSPLPLPFLARAPVVAPVPAVRSALPFPKQCEEVKNYINNNGQVEEKEVSLHGFSSVSHDNYGCTDVKSKWGASTDFVTTPNGNESSDGYDSSAEEVVMPVDVWHDGESAVSQMQEDRRRKGGPGSRAVYRCRRCMAPKKGHLCPFEVDGLANLQTCVTTAEAPPSKKLKHTALAIKRTQDEGVKVDDEVYLNEAERVEIPAPMPLPFPHHSENTCKTEKSRAEALAEKFCVSSKWLFETGVLEGHTVRYMARPEQVLKTGVIRNGAIVCSCQQCGGRQIFNASTFEKHAGSTAKHPSDFIYLENGKSLRDVLEVGFLVKCKSGMIDAMQKAVSEAPIEDLIGKDDVDDQDDDAEARDSSIDLTDGRSLDEAAMSLAKLSSCCLKCGLNGELIYCKSCSGAYHRECISLDEISERDWSCHLCQKDERRLKRHILQAKEAAVCTICRVEILKPEFWDMTVISCDQCERKFHVGCLKIPLELSQEEWFCGEECQHIHTMLSSHVSNGEEIVPRSISASVLGKAKGSIQRSDLSWQLLHAEKNAGNVLLEALTIFTSCFEPIVDATSGQNLIPLIVHSQSMHDLEFGGMYCIVVKHRGKVISAGMLRIFGESFAEIPLAATSTDFQGMGYFQALLGCIERLLRLLKVKQIVVPAPDEAQSIWLDKFGFSQMPDDEIEEHRKQVQLMLISGSSILRKKMNLI